MRTCARLWVVNLVFFIGCDSPPSEPEKIAVKIDPAAVAASKADPVESKPAVRKQLELFATGDSSGPMILTHAGVGSPPDQVDGAQKAADAGLAVLVDGGSALDAAVQSTVVLEDDPRFNAGTGANIRLDGKTIQMDASLMTDGGDFAAVAVIERVKNPIKAARLVLDSPHVMLAGEGATRFAHKMGLADEIPLSAEAKQSYETRMAELSAAVDKEAAAVDWRDYWNFPGPMPAAMKKWKEHGDTVGTVVRDGSGRFAAALSTGGTSVTLYGRVGDVPIYGAGQYAGPAGAVACTGHGEEIVRRAIARTIHDKMAAGMSASEAVHEAVAAFPDQWHVGIIAIDRRGWAVGANSTMAFGKAFGVGPKE